ncbi:MAG TPA: GDSL-type esterase/lipase family protein, partial [Verrucomicrobiae bacterium]|nr:GDSL-type esterase/lipase family protein [Verrucomicrobiae bacterium]
TPGIDVYARGVHVMVNAQGLRGPAIATRPAPGVHLVLALGDSVTFGERLAVEEAFPALLERELAARTGERWEVLNAGVDGYNTEAELAFLRQRGLPLAPETVVVCFNLNDYDQTPALGPLNILTRDPAARLSARSLASHSEFYFLLRWLVMTRGRPFGNPEAVPAGFAPRPGERFSAFDRYVSALRTRYYARPRDGRWQVMVDSLRGLGETARARGLRLVIAIQPDGDQVGVPDPDLLPQRKVLAICAEAGLDCLDLYPVFAAAARDGELFFDIVHPNAAGHRLIARALADHLLGG